ncbi:MAG TPA: lamin tail domain-containing protein, partial [Thermoplasmata archaeon]|nr:lamin tail domain-containing protein [Thermoplasmata archaeon]
LFGLYVAWQDNRNGLNQDIYFSSYVITKPLLTEFRDAPDPSERVEILNYGGKSLDMTGYSLNVDGFTFSLAPLGSVPANAYRTIGPTGSGASLQVVGFSVGGSVNQGGFIELRDFTNAVIDSVRYGQEGVAPDPLTSASMSVARYFDGTAYTDCWAVDLSSTMAGAGAQNDGPGCGAPPELLLNEVVYDAPNPSERFVELYYTGSASLDVTGYRLQGNSVHTVLSGAVLTAANRHFLIWNNDSVSATLLFNNLALGGDNLYLYRPTANGELLDEVGWDTLHTQGTSVCRTPEGAGTSDGFNDTTTVAARWQFGCTPSPALLAIGPPQVKFGGLGDVVRFNLTVTNKQSQPDTLDLTYTSAPNGWPVTLYEADGSTLLADTDGDLVPDTGVLGWEESTAINVSVTVPLAVPTVAFEYVNVTAGSSLRLALATAPLRVNIYPFLQINRWANPTTINVLGMGSNEVTTITLELRGRGLGVPGQGFNAIDVVFVIDDTGSMGTWIAQAQSDATTITDAIIANVTTARFGLVSYGDFAAGEIDVDIDLTTDVNAFKAALNALVASGGGDWEEDPDIALETAANLSWGGPNVAKVMILIGDAPAHDNQHLVDIASWANTTKGIHTNAILCGDDPTAAFWFSAAAAASGGFYYQLGFPSEMADAIINGILYFVPAINVAAKDPDVFDPIPMVRDVLPPYIAFIPGTFWDPFTMTAKGPDYIGTDAFGNTILDWNVSAIVVNETWQVQFDVTSSLVGYVPTNVYGLSRATFLDFNNVSTTLLFPEVFITVLGPTILPVEEVTTTWNGGTQVGL